MFAHISRMQLHAVVHTGTHLGEKMFLISVHEKEKVGAEGEVGEGRKRPKGLMWKRKFSQ